MKREDYKSIKHMDKRTLDNYLMDIYIEGYRAGVKVMADELRSRTGTSTMPAETPRTGEASA